MSQVHQLKTKYNGIARQLDVQVGLCPAFDPAKETRPDPVLPFGALWDTGASNTVITQKVVDALKLPPLGLTHVHTAAGASLAQTYLIALHLPGGVGFNSVRVTLGDLGAGTDVLIGMDIIGTGDFCVTNDGGNTHVHFQVPSQGIRNLHKGLFAQPINVQVNNPTQGGPLIPRVGRNALCPCGSGKKYKHCHGR